MHALPHAEGIKGCHSRREKYARDEARTEMKPPALPHPKVLGDQVFTLARQRGKRGEPQQRMGCRNPSPASPGCVGVLLVDGLAPALEGAQLTCA